VAGYTITITPNDNEAGAHTTIRVDTTSGSARITELTVRAGEGGAIFPQQLPALNLDQLIAALVPPATTAITAMSGPTEQAVTEQAAVQQAATEQAAAPAATLADVSAPEVEVVRKSPEMPQSTASPVRAGRPSRAKKAGPTAPAKKAPTRSRQTKAERAAATAQSTSDRRAYRRMPEPADVLAAYLEVGGTTALARHYGVPRHTATGWLRRLRNQGMLD
jgi:hypothetical protein